MLNTPETVLLVLLWRIFDSVGLLDSPSDTAESDFLRSRSSVWMEMGWDCVAAMVEWWASCVGEVVSGRRSVVLVASKLV